MMPQGKLEAFLGMNKVSIMQCQELGKEFGFNGSTFDLCGPLGKKPCTWVDAYMGLFQIDGDEGIIMVDDNLKFAQNLWCENFNPKDKE